MATVIAVSNQKGGVGKTSTTNAFAAGLKNKGFRVLAVDMDPQSNLSSSVEADMSLGVPTIFEVLKNGIPARDAIQTLPPFDLIPACLLLAGFEQELISMTFGRDQKLKEALSPLLDDYDFILIDTAPSLTLLTINALAAANEVVIPATAEFFAASGLEQLYDTIQAVRRYASNPDLTIAGILFTLHDPRTINGQLIRAETQKYADAIGTRIFNTHIRKAIAMGESQTSRQDIFRYSPKSTVAKDYANFVDEYLKTTAKERRDS